MTQGDYDQDVQQIRAALHNSTGSRASVMVGSGFSFNAQKRYESAVGFPSWSSLTESLVDRLYPTDQKARRRALKDAGATNGALRFAQEFEAAFSRTVLLNHLREMLPDGEHEPGQLHTDLLNLPWADVFTTNYDTLLERATHRLRERRYEIVRCVSDLPLKRDPRIIKLHGTLPELSDCILTEEDFRTYPDKFSPFVAEVQVAMVESHLCLVGFSGDDPNFLAWSGWVRDRLGKHTLPIYLWTFDKLTTFQTRLLEQRSVIPLPLSVITGESKREAALQKFLEMLKTPPGKIQPKWCFPRYPTNEIFDKESLPPTSPRQELSSKDWLNVALDWRANRKLYPNWMVPHVRAIENLWDNTQRWAELADSNPAGLSSLNEPCCVFVLYELLWRIRRSIFPAFDNLALDTWDQAIHRYSTWRKDQKETSIRIGTDSTNIIVEIKELDFAVMELRLERLRHAREIGNFDEFKKILSEIEKNEKILSKEHREHCKHFLEHQKSLVFLSTWDDAELKKLLSAWNTSSTPIWALRRAGLMIEIGDWQAAREILMAAQEDLRTTADDGTPETWSIESWVIYVLRSLDWAKKFFSRPESKDQSQPFDERPKPEPTIIKNDLQDAEDDRRQPKKHRSSEETKSTPDDQHHAEFQRTLDWLRERSCDPKETLDWLNQQNAREFSRTNAPLRMQSFDSRRWRWHINFENHDFDQRNTAAYRALRLIEDAGLPLRSENVRFLAPLAEKAIQFLADRDALETTGIVLRIRTKKLIERWFTRFRIATFSKTEVRRLYDIAETCIRRLAENPEALKGNTVEKQQFEAAAELLSRIAISADDPALEKLFRFTMTLPIMLRIWDRWWLADALAILLRRTCEGLSNSAFWGMLPEMLKFPVPGSPNFPSLPGHVSWIDPVTLLDQRDTIAMPFKPEDIIKPISALITRILMLGNDSNSESERRYLILRLVSLADRGLLNDEQQQEFAKALYSRRDPDTGFPIDTGCFDSLVLLSPEVEGVDEHSLFTAEYISKPWPPDSQLLCGLLETLARTGPLKEDGAENRLRGINWSTTEIQELSARCCWTITQQTQVFLNEPAAEGGSHPMRNLAFSKKDWAVKIVAGVAEVIDEVLLDREELPPGVWEEILSAVTRAREVRLPVLRLYPKLVSFDLALRGIFVDEIVLGLGGGDEDRLKNVIISLNRWANQLWDSRIPRIPDIVVISVVGKLVGEYSHKLIHILDTIRNLLLRLPANQSRRLLQRCESSLEDWTRRFDYNAASQGPESDRRMREELPDLRASMTRLCVVARNRNLESDTVTNWLDSVADETMPELRQALEDQAT